jgi:hypothetical protein
MIENRTVWLYWHQGFDAAPDLVRACARSWQERNPGWTVQQLDQHSIGKYVDISAMLEFPRPDITLQKTAVLARLALLERFGGVWADATVFCMDPLDSWLPQRMESGFFAFQMPDTSRLMSNWFMAAERGNLLHHELHEAFFRLFREHRFTNQETRFGKWTLSVLARYLDTTVERTRLWLSPLVLRGLKVHPYFIFHFTFNKIVLDNPACRDIWSRTPLLKAGPSLLFQNAWRHDRTLESALAKARKRKAPVYKLNWRAHLNPDYWNAVLAYLQAQTYAAVGSESPSSVAGGQT